MFTRPAPAEENAAAPPPPPFSPGRSGPPPAPAAETAGHWLAQPGNRWAVLSTLLPVVLGLLWWASHFVFAQQSNADELKELRAEKTAVAVPLLKAEVEQLRGEVRQVKEAQAEGMREVKATQTEQGRDIKQILTLMIERQGR